MNQLNCVIIFLFFPSLLFSQQIELNVAYTNWLPYTYTDDNEAKGFEIEILKAVFKRMDIKPIFNNYPWKRCLNQLKNGGADVLISMLKTEERETYTYYPSENISYSICNFFTNSQNKIVFNGELNSLQDYKIGVILGFNYGKEFTDADNLNKIQVNDSEILYKLVSKQRIPIGLDNTIVISNLAQNLDEYNDITFLEPPILNDKLFVGFSKKNNLKKLSSDFSEELIKYKKTAEYQTILDKFKIPF